MTLIIVRHGETPLNVTRVLQPPDTPLSPNGQAQAAAVARRLAGMAPAGIVSSDLARAHQTAQAIAAATGLPVHSTPLLQERNFGALRGLAYDTLGYDPLVMDEAPQDGESSAGFAERVAQALAHVRALQAELGGPLVVVTHGLVIRQLLQSALQLPEGTDSPEHLGNTSLTLCTASPPHAIQLVNCTLHLDAGDAADKPLALSGG